MKWFLKALRQYADFSGRARKKEYWMFVLFYAIFACAISALDFFIFDTPLYERGSLFRIYEIALLVPYLAVSVRRLHDIGKSGWWWCLIFFTAFVAVWLNLFSFTAVNAIVIIQLCILIFMIVITFVVTVVWACFDSQEGRNKWGPNPKEISEASESCT